jgi:hypothetical protein
VHDRLNFFLKIVQCRTELLFEKQEKGPKMILPSSSECRHGTQRGVQQPLATQVPVICTVPRQVVAHQCALNLYCEKGICWTVGSYDSAEKIWEDEAPILSRSVYDVEAKCVEC